MTKSRRTLLPLCCRDRWAIAQTLFHCRSNPVGLSSQKVNATFGTAQPLLPGCTSSLQALLCNSHKRSLHLLYRGPKSLRPIDPASIRWNLPHCNSPESVCRGDTGFGCRRLVRINGRVAWLPHSYRASAGGRCGRQILCHHNCSIPFRQPNRLCLGTARQEVILSFHRPQVLAEADPACGVTP